MNSGIQLLASLDGINQEIKAMESRSYKADSPARDYLLFKYGNTTMHESRPLCASFFANKKVVETGGERPLRSSDAYDAHEYITWLLEHLSDDDIVDQGPKKMYPGTTQRISKLSDMYFVETRSQIVHGGKTLSEKSDFEPYILASIAGQKKLTTCLAQFTAPEAGVKYKHDNTKLLVEKHRRFVKLPEYLFLGLKRTERDRETGRLVRHADKISFPMVNLFQELLPQSAKLGITHQDLYDLVAVTVQSGSATGGHYKAYTKYGSTWYHCNDKSTSQITDKDMVTFANTGQDAAGFLPTLFVYKKRVISPQERQDHALALDVAAEEIRKAQAEREQRKEEAEREAADRALALVIAEEESLAQQAAQQREFLKKAAREKAARETTAEKAQETARSRRTKEERAAAIYRAAAEYAEKERKASLKQP
jgi:hypothetical protein